MIYSPIWIIFFPATFILSDFIHIYFHIYIYIYTVIYICCFSTTHQECKSFEEYEEFNDILCWNKFIMTILSGLSFLTVTLYIYIYIYIDFYIYLIVSYLWSLVSCRFYATIIWQRKSFSAWRLSFKDVKKPVVVNKNPYY